MPQPPATAPQPAPATSAEKSVQRVTSLATERRWLQSWFHGTPVVIAQPDDATVTVDVPLVHDFDRGDSRIKPALAALLDKVAESLRRRPAIRLTRIAAPGDGSVGSLAARRAEAVRRHLLARGVPAVQLGEATTTAAPAVQLRLETPSG